MTRWTADVFDVATGQALAFCLGALAGILISEVLVRVELRAVGNTPVRPLRHLWIAATLFAAVIALILLRDWVGP